MGRTQLSPQRLSEIRKANIGRVIIFCEGKTREIVQNGNIEKAIDNARALEKQYAAEGDVGGVLSVQRSWKYHFSIKNMWKPGIICGKLEHV